MNNRGSHPGHTAARFVHLQVLIRIVFLAMLLLAPAVAQPGVEPRSPVDPLPQDTGTAGLRQMLLRLQTTGRLLHTTAHPDDEDGGMLTLESRGKGVTAWLLTLNRGEGGQNKVGSNLFDVLGVLRTLELTASDRYYGVEQRFTRVADFGFSKSAEETFQKWQGHDGALADMVRVIRTFRPDVLVSRFGGTDRDGHGHHRASGILSREAFRAAADRNRFPEQIKEGLLPWQAKKLYIDNVCPFRSNECPGENYTLKLSTGELNPALGVSYIQFAMEGLKHQLSQGAGSWSVNPGPHYAFYKLVDSVLPRTTDTDGHEKDFFDGIDTSLPGLAATLGAEEAKVPWLRGALEKVADKVHEATNASSKDASSAAGPLFAVAQGLREIIGRVDGSDLGQAAKAALLTHLRNKQQQAETALNLAMTVDVQAVVLAKRPDSGASLPHEQDALTVISPGQRFDLYVTFHNGSRYPLVVENVTLEGFDGWVTDAYRSPMEAIRPGDDYGANFRMQVPVKVAYTRPYWHRQDPEQETLNTISEPEYGTLAFPPSPFHVRVKYSITGRKDLSYSVWNDRKFKIKGTEGPGANISVPVLVPYLDEKGAERKRDLAVAPVFSVMLDPGEQVIPLEVGAATTVRVGVSSNLTGATLGTLRLQVPPGWRVEPEKLLVKLDRRGKKQDFEFKVFPASLKEGKAQIRAVLVSKGTEYSEGYSVVTREDLDTFYYYQPAIQRVSIVDVRIPKDLKVGYVMGAGDDIPTVLQQLGMDIRLIPAEQLASEDLSRYGTIVLGIRAYDTQKGVAANNKKLLDFVSAGGTLVVQYNTGVGDFNSGHFAPYPAQLSRARVSVEEAPVEILAPEDGVFHFPNQITQHDFDGWVQERGLYFMDQWDSHFQALLACHDPGEQPQKGGLLRAQYGKGTYIYTGYAFFRQLPAGVPGAVRLYVNLLSAGTKRSE